MRCDAPLPWGQSILILFWTFFFIRDVSISPICLCIQLFIYTNMESYLYCRLYSVLLYILTFFSCGYWKLFQLTTMSLWHIPIIVGFYLRAGGRLLYFLAPHHAIMLVLHITYPKLRIWYISKYYWFLYFDNGVRKGLVCFTTRMSLL